LIERSKPMFGERFQAMIDLAFSTLTLVRSGGGPSSTSSRTSSQSPSRFAQGEVELRRRPILGRAAAVMDVWAGKGLP
jgi:hypothetical protein